MPYKLSKSGKCVMVKRTTGWKIYKCYTGTDAKERARKLLAALVINVGNK